MDASYVEKNSGFIIWSMNYDDSVYMIRHYNHGIEVYMFVMFYYCQPVFLCDPAYS